MAACVRRTASGTQQHHAGTRAHGDTCAGTRACFAHTRAVLAQRTQVNGMQLADKVVFVGPFLKRGDRGSGDNKFTNV